MRRMSACRQPLTGMSIRRYLPPIGTAGFERVAVRGKRRDPWPPPRTMASVSVMDGWRDANTIPRMLRNGLLRVWRVRRGLRDRAVVAGRGGPGDRHPRRRGVRQARLDEAAGRHGHQRRAGGRRADAVSSRPWRRGGPASQPVRRPAGGVPCRGDAQALERFRHQDGAVAARILERQVPRHGKRRPGRWHAVAQRAGRRCAPRLCHRVAQHRSRWGFQLCDGAPRADQGLRLSRHARDDRGLEGADSRLLRQAAERLLHGRGRRRHHRGAQLGTALSGGLRHAGRHRHVVVSDPPHVRADVGVAGHAPGRRQLHPAGSLSGAAPRGVERLRQG